MGDGTMRNARFTIRSRRSSAGLSLVEMLIALAITAMLLTATMVSIDASFKAYAAAAETASTQSSTRMVVNRLLTLVRTSIAHAPVVDSNPSAGDAGYAEWSLMRAALRAQVEPQIGAAYPDPEPELSDTSDDVVESAYLRMLDPEGRDVLIEWVPALKELWLVTVEPSATSADARPLLGGVTAAKFSAHQRIDSDGVLVLERATMDLKVEADDDNTLAIENGELPPIRVIASTMPRKLE